MRPLSSAWRDCVYVRIDRCGAQKFAHHSKSLTAALAPRQLLDKGHGALNFTSSITTTATTTTNHHHKKSPDPPQRCP